MTGTKPKRRPLAEETDGFMTMARSEAAKAEALGLVSRVCTVVPLTTTGKRIGKRKESGTGKRW